MELSNKQSDLKKLNEFHTVLKNIKKTVLDKFTYNSQNVNDLKKVSKRLIQFYMLLKPVVYDNKPLESIPLKEIRDLFITTLSDPYRSSYYQNHLEYYLKRDFIDYPLTIDNDSYTINYGEPELIGNNLSLTI